MARYSIIKYKWTVIIAIESQTENYYKLPDVTDRYGTPYWTTSLSKAKQMITRVLHGNSKNYRISNH